MFGTITRAVGKVGLLLRHNSPSLLIAAGAVGLVGSIVLASKATLNLEETLDESAKSEKPLAQPCAVVKLYLPAAGLAVFSIGLIIGGNTIHLRRNAAAIAAYEALRTSYENYRSSVVEEVGQAREEEIFKNSTKIFERKEFEDAKALDDGFLPPWTTQNARWFGPDTSIKWQRSADQNELLINMTETHLNTCLKARGHVFLNEALDKLGLERTAEGAILGWIYDPKSDGDQIDLGHWALRNGNYEDGEAILLDFNVIGVIHQKLKSTEAVAKLRNDTELEL